MTVNLMMKAPVDLEDGTKEDESSILLSTPKKKGRGILLQSITVLHRFNLIKPTIYKYFKFYLI